MSKKTIAIEDEVEEFLGSLAISARRLRGGRCDGVLLIELTAGPTHVWIVPDRGLGIWKIESGNIKLGWQSPIAGPVHPKFVPLAEPSGIGCLDGFDELLARCGLQSNGAPDFDSQGKLLHGLHGRIANSPAHDIHVTLNEETGTVTLTGVVNETRFLVHDLQMTTTLKISADRPQIAWTDTIQNRSDKPTTFQMLYHFNLGPPLLGAGGELIADAAEIAPRDMVAVSDIPSWNSYAAPLAGRTEQVHFMKLRTHDDGRAAAMLVAPDKSKAARLSWRAAELPCFTLWKNQGGLADGYVTGLEPGTNYPNTRSFEESQQRVVPLAPHQSITFDLSIDILTGDAIESERQQLQGVPPVLHHEPKHGWSP